ncbi:MAG TPA: type II secretion system protein N [Gammaproteobacteria bacterium]|nr:type II secretion system protein N [Gammaproteobacteria bacterium]
MSRRSWFALGLGLYVAFALAMFPAGVAVRWLAPPGVTCAGVAGTLWSGSAATCSVNRFTAESLRWRLRPTSLFLGRVSANVEARIPDGFVSGDVTASTSSVRFSDLRAATSLPALGSVLPVLRGMRGQASVSIESLVLENGWPATAVGEVKLAGLESLPLIPDGRGAYVPIGDYTVTLVPASERELAATFVDNGGPLEVAGTAKLDASRTYTIDALVEPRANAPETLVQGLSIMTAEPDAEGRRRLNLTGSL